MFNPASSSVLVGHLVAALAERRRALGMSQEDVDAKLGWADRLLCKYEAGTRTPSMQAISWWAEALGMKLMVGVDFGIGPSEREIKKAAALVYLSNGKGVRSIARKLDLPPSTLSAWRRAVQGRHRRKS